MSETGIVRLKRGWFFSCEPGIYIIDEKIGIRIENDILITEDGPVDLTKNIPVEADEIESLMNNNNNVSKKNFRRKNNLLNFSYQVNRVATA